jgi:hypothetical protein
MNGNAEPAQNGLKQVTVLGSDANARLEPVSMAPQFANDGRELYRFRARAQNHKDLRTFG